MLKSEKYFAEESKAHAGLR